MSNLAYSFELTPEDYVAMNMNARAGMKPFLLAALPSSAALGLVLFAMLGLDRSRNLGSAALVATAVAIAFFVFQSLWWKYRLRRHFLKYYARAPRDRLFGPHTLAISDEGIESTGPHHRTFRAWPAITQARFTADRLFLHTIFGAVYVLPLRAVANRDELREALATRLRQGAIRNT